MTPLELSLLEQGSELWKQARVGLVTASRCADVIAMTKKGEGADRRNYRYELLCERLTGFPYPQYVSAEMQWGIDQEPFARAAYELQRDVLVETCGFIVHPSVANFGASPDFLVGEAAWGRSNAPPQKHIWNGLWAESYPVEHMAQMMAELSCTGREWCDFVSFDPRLPEHLQLFIRRFERNEKLISTLESEVRHFNYELDDCPRRLTAEAHRDRDCHGTGLIPTSCNSNDSPPPHPALQDSPRSLAALEVGRSRALLPHLLGWKGSLRRPERSREKGIQAAPGGDGPAPDVSLPSL